MFEQFLSADMTYSCGIFRDLDADFKQGKGDASGPRKMIQANGGNANGYSSASVSTSGTDGDEASTVGEVDELEEAQLAKLR